MLNGMSESMTVLSAGIDGKLNGRLGITLKNVKLSLALKCPVSEVSPIKFDEQRSKRKQGNVQRNEKDILSHGLIIARISHFES